MRERIDAAVDITIYDMPDEYVIKPYLEGHKTEVKGMLLTEYNEAEQIELFKEEGRAEGREEGILDTLISLVRQGILTAEIAAKQANLSLTSFRTL